MQNKFSDEGQVRQRLLVLFLIIVSVLLARFGLTRGIPALGLIIPAVFIVSKLLDRPKQLFIFILILNFLPILIPGVSQVISLRVLSQALIVGWALLDAAIWQKKRNFSYQRGTDMWMGVFVINLLLIMAVRGAGFRLLGGAVYGGAAYVTLLMAVFFYFAAVRIRLTEKDIKILVLILLGGALLYTVIEMLAYYFTGAFGWVTRVVLFDYGERGIDYSEQVEGVDTVRWGSIRWLAAAMIPVAFVWCRHKNLRTALTVGAVLLVGLAGSRSNMTLTVAVIFFAYMIFSKNKGKVFILWLLMGVAGLGFLSVATPMLPPTIQRSVSFIPFLDVDPDVKLNVKQSNDFRFDMWRDYCIPNVPKYLLIGRGLARDITQYSWASRQTYRSGEFFYYMGSYHSGPFDVLLNYGLAGTVSFTLFFLSVIVDGWRTVRRYARHQDTFAARYFTYLTLWLTFEIAAYFFIFGHIVSQISWYMAAAVQMRIIKKNFLMGEPGAAVSEVRDQPSDVSQTGQQLTGGSVRPVNGWTRPSAARRQMS